MHVRGFCLCPECHVRDATHEDEVRTVAKVHIACLASAGRRGGVRRIIRAGAGHGEQAAASAK